MVDLTKKCGVLYRLGEVIADKDGVRSLDVDARTVDIAFSSETPVERYFGNEILDHTPSSVRLGRLKDKGPFLVDHNRTDQVGVIESVSIDADRRGRAKIRFGKSVRADEIFTDVVDGIRSHISVGYRVHEWTEKENGDTRVTDWEPMEISAVSIPADISVGVGRDAPGEENEVRVHTFKEAIVPDAVKDPTPPVDVKKVAQEARTAEQTRIREISALGRRNGHAELADKFVESGRPLDEFRGELLNSLEQEREAAEKKRKDEAPASQLGMEVEQVKRYSLMRAIRASVTGNWKGAEFERECSVTIEEGMEDGRQARGFFVPLDVQMAKRVMNVGSKNPDGLGPDNVGSDLVGTDHLAGSFIDFLYTQSVLFGAGATLLDGLVGNVDIPRQESTTTFNWLTEDQDNTDDDITTGTVSLTPTTIAGSVPMTRRLMKQSSPSVEAMVMSDLARGAALAIDLAAIQGSGAAAEPTGVVNQTGVQVNTLAVAGQPTWAELVNFETLLDEADAANGTLAYITTPSIIGYLKTTPKETAQAIYLMDSDRRSGVSAGLSGSANGYDVRRRTGLAANTLTFGEWAQCMIGMWGVLDVMADTATKAKSGGLVLRVFQDVDVAVRTPQSFSVANLI